VAGRIWGRIRAGASVLAALALLAGASVAPPAGAAPRALTAEQVANAEVRNVYAPKGLVKLAKGAYEEPAGAPPAKPLRIRLEGPVALGDLDGDGAGDAAAVLVTELPTGAATYDLVAFVNRGGLPVFAGAAHLGERLAVKAAAIEDGRIALELIVWHLGQPANAPGSELRRAFALAGGVLEERGPAR
jgi:hypothetical protein